MSKRAYLVVALFLFLMTPVSLAEFGYDNPNLPKVTREPEVTTFNNNTAFVNNSEFCGGVLCTLSWLTDGSRSPATGDWDLGSNSLDVGTLSLGGNIIQSSSGTVNFNSDVEVLGNDLDVGFLTFSGSSITELFGIIFFGDDDLETSGNIRIVSDSNNLSIGAGKDFLFEFDGTDATIVGDVNSVSGDLNLGAYSGDYIFGNSGGISLHSPLNFEDSEVLPGGFTVSRNIFITGTLDGATNNINQFVHPKMQDSSIYEYDTAQSLLFNPTINSAGVNKQTSAVADPAGIRWTGFRATHRWQIAHNGVGSTDSVIGFHAFSLADVAGGSSGTGTVASMDGIRSEPSIKTGITATDLNFYNIVEGVNTGTIDTQNGLMIPSLTDGTNNNGISSLMTEGSNNLFINHSEDARSEFGGDIHFKGDNIGNFFGLSNDVKTFFNSSGHYDEVQIGSVSRIFKDYANISFESDVFIEGFMNATTYHLSNGGNITSNSSCMILASPDGTTTSNICNVGF